jgi:hypothetical protein
MRHGETLLNTVDPRYTAGSDIPREWSCDLRRLCYINVLSTYNDGSCNSSFEAVPRHPWCDEGLYAYMYLLICSLFNDAFSVTQTI